MNLNLAWSAPTPIPSCGYKALYRRKGDPSYTEADTSGTTATILIAAPASYEGSIISNCCSDESSGTPYGVNAYSALIVTPAIDLNHVLTVTVTSLYANPYDTIVFGSFTVNAVPVSFSVTYPANSTTHTFTIAGSYTGAIAGLSADCSSIFDNGGQLQRFDFVNTPPYFHFYWSGNISGTTWNGAPSDLPSFTLDAFTATEISPDGTTVLAGTLDMSYILHTFYPTIYTTVTIEVFDPLNVAPIGSIVVGTSPLGLRSTAISLAKGTSPLTSATAFIMKTFLPNLTLLDTKTFYLPS